MKAFKKLTKRITGSFKDLLRDYLKNSSVAGCAYYVAAETRPKDRFFWLVIHITCIILLTALTVDVTIEYTNSPTVTFEETGSTPIQDVDFPGIAICNVNKISLSEAVEVAKDIMDYDYGGNFTLDEITDALKYLGHLYLFELNDDEEDVIEILHKLLIRRYKSYVPDLLHRLRTPCKRILQYCSWGGREQSCDDVFFTRKTADGYCCTFNYVRPSDSFGGKNSVGGIVHYGGIERVEAAGLKYGLTVLLRPDIGDHHYKILPVLGYKISVFSSLDYPDAPSGALREVIVSPRMEASLTVQATTFYTVKEVSRYDVDVRDCLFSDELNVRFGGYYSYSDCIMYCRISDIVKLCRCIPFFYPTLTIGGKKVRTCDLKDLRCLKEYKPRWWRVKPRFEEPMTPFNDSVSQGRDGVLDCSECFPACADVAYQVSVTSEPLKLWETFSDRDSTKFVNHSLVNIFFRRTESIRLKQDVMFYWYELMSNYGGVCGFFLGISIISIVEFFYFFTLRLYKRKDDKEEKGINLRFTFVKAAKPSLRPLYWHEMIQPNAKY